MLHYLSDLCVRNEMDDKALQEAQSVEYADKEVKTARSSRWPSWIIFLLVSSFLGIASMIGPAFVSGKARVNEKFSLRKSMEAGYPPSLVGLFVSGIILGALTSKPRWSIALSCIGFLPLWAIIDGAINPRYHNMMPFELVVHMILGFIVWSGALIGRGFRDFMWSRIKASSNGRL